MYMYVEMSIHVHVTHLGMKVINQWNYPWKLMINWEQYINRLNDTLSETSQSSRLKNIDGGYFLSSKYRASFRTHTLLLLTPNCPNTLHIYKPCSWVVDYASSTKCHFLFTVCHWWTQELWDYSRIYILDLLLCHCSKNNAGNSQTF